MNLEHITIQVCATCGAHAVQESKDKQHCNGEWNEERVFSCGSIVVYSPNFQAERTTSRCPLDPDITKLRKRATAKSKTIKYINGLDVDDDYKKILNIAVNTCE